MITIAPAPFETNKTLHKLKPKAVLGTALTIYRGVFDSYAFLVVLDGERLRLLNTVSYLIYDFEELLDIFGIEARYNLHEVIDSAYAVEEDWE